MAGTLTISTLSDGTNSTSSTNCIQGSAKAWVRFNGVTATIASSYNVSSVTRSALGKYVVNFTNALPNTNYVAVGSPSPDTGYAYNPGPVIFFTNGSSIVAPSTTSISLIQYSANFSAYIDPLYESVAIFST